MRRAFDATVNGVTVQQPDSVFEKLPPELRNKVYYYYFDQGDAFTISHYHGGDTKKRCDCKGNSENIRNITNLLKVCKLIYTEAKPVLFHNREFEFPCVSSLASFVHHIVPKDRCLVRNITFHYCGSDGPRGFKMLASYPALQSLKIKLSMKTEAGMNNIDRKNCMRAPGLGNLLKLRGVGSVVLESDEKITQFWTPSRVDDLRQALKALEGLKGSR